MEMLKLEIRLRIMKFFDNAVYFKEDELQLQKKFQRYR